MSKLHLSMCSVHTLPSPVALQIPKVWPVLQKASGNANTRGYRWDQPVFSLGSFSIAPPPCLLHSYSIDVVTKNDWCGCKPHPSHTHLLGLKFILGRTLEINIHVSIALPCQHLLITCWYYELISHVHTHQVLLTRLLTLGAHVRGLQ